HEALSLGDRITILRHGKVAGALDERQLRESSPEEVRATIIRIMFGEAARAVADVAELQEELVERDRAAAAQREAVLELEEVSVPAQGAEMGVEDVSLALGLGEILGVAGIDGNGQRALAETIAGQRS